MHAGAPKGSPPEGGPDVSILIVTYRNPELTLACLESVYRETRGIDFEVLVHDNGSDDGTPDAVAEHYPQVDLSRDQGNLGFARANNLLARRARGRHLLLLNPDTELHGGTVQRLLGVAKEHPDLIPLGGRTLRPDGRLDPRSCFGAVDLWALTCFATGLSAVLRGSARFNPEAIGGWARNDRRQVGVVSGCLALLPRSAWEHLGGFDERFWLYGEDLDLCLRAAAAGWRPSITPEATITHVLGASSNRGDKTTLVLQAKATVLQKHRSPAARAAGLALMLTGVAVRAAAERPFRAGEGAWSYAWTQRRRWLSGFPHVPPDIMAR